jgi:hypothetical protein
MGKTNHSIGFLEYFQREFERCLMLNWLLRQVWQL